MTSATVSPNVVKSTSPSSSSSKPVPATAVSKGPSSLLPDQSQDIPIFLRKTFHMIDTCDPAVASWSEDGETFVVKDPMKFEKQIIPQFFKHSKFSSFVRQLNFYAFRKIKYSDTIRIDPKLEAETANYWRFRHEKFQKGKPELLAEIKRMNGQKQLQQQQSNSIGAKGGIAAKGVDATGAVLPPLVEKENSALKSEVSNLKQRIEAMTRNIDELTHMVQKVTLITCPPEEDKLKENKKRTKVEDASAMVPDRPGSSSVRSLAAMATPEPSPSEAMSMDLDAFPLPPSMPSPMPVDRTTSITTISDLSDEGFVDHLFTAFKTEDFIDFDSESVIRLDDEKMDNGNNNNHNRPCPELMNRLSDALSALPRDIQELIVDRLIQAITSPKDIQDQIRAAAIPATKEEKGQTSSLSSLSKPDATPALQMAPTKDPKQIANLQLAAATLAALLSQCGGEAQQQHKDSHKALLIPVHA